MRRVIKNGEPGSIRAWKDLENEDWSASYGVLQNPQKADLHIALIREQQGLCCYCGREIVQNDSHIEHFRPQHRYPDLDLNYSNLFASCIRITMQGIPSHCGHAKDNWFDEAAVISPLDVDCEERFNYLADGVVVPTAGNDISAETMIERLALNIPYLKNRREATIAGMFDDDFIETATDDELQELMAVFGNRRDDSGPFPQVIYRFAMTLL